MRGGAWVFLNMGDGVMSDELKARFVRDNGDGTETWMAPVTVRKDAIAGFEVVCVRSPIEGEFHLTNKGSDVAYAHHPSSRLVVIVKPIPKPTWTPPASLKPGRYRWCDRLLWNKGTSLSCFETALFRDWTVPPAVGVWVVNEDGTATFEGEGSDDCNETSRQT